MVERLSSLGRVASARPPKPEAQAKPPTEEKRLALFSGDRLSLEARVPSLERQLSRTRPTPIPPEGRLEYYQQRHQDFQARYPDASPPSYYLGYGDVYVRRFTEVLSPELSEEGQEWMVRARQNLQLAIEAELARNPEIELDDQAFTAFAYATHSRAYLDAGLTRLPIDDLIRVAVTPNLRDTLNKAGLAVIAETAEVVARDKLAAALDAPKETAKELLHALATSPDLMRDVFNLLATTDNAQTLLDGLVKLGSWPKELAVSLMDELWARTNDRMQRAVDSFRKVREALRTGSGAA